MPKFLKGIRIKNHSTLRFFNESCQNTLHKIFTLYVEVSGFYSAKLFQVRSKRVQYNMFSQKLNIFAKTQSSWEKLKKSLVILKFQSIS